MDRLPDLSISGVGKTDGGKFSDVDISGLGKIFGDLEAERVVISGKGTVNGNAKVVGKIEISGMGTVDGSVYASRLITSGSGSIGGNIEVESIESTGNLKVNGSAQVHELSCDGRCRIDKHLRAEKIISRGYLSVGSDIEAEDFYSRGSFAIEGLLNANQVDIEIHGFCKAKEIGGEKINVRHSGYVNPPVISKLITSFLGNGREVDKLTAELIEGTEVSLEYTHAKIVRGNRIVIGPECVIDVVEYTDSLEIDPKASVLKQTKL